eukprot:TRINITY_DN18176_c0_g1_i3.p1 TRINITY_DN18176_c0_g1~~TRINITY_DN18176_c0_g1_i3.p1  ORF type:complete len:1473 (+),score=358.27 TRINITY_DN18176_c0_g1_i3:650-4420(+)
MAAAFEARGGVLADQIGYGKTAVTIGLIDVRQGQALPQVPKRDEGCYFESKATLVCVPSHLHQQWYDEIAKFTGKRFNVVRLRTGADMSKETVKSLSEADIVLCNYQLLHGPHYQKRRLELVDQANVPINTGNARKCYAALFGSKSRSAKEVPLEDLRRGTWSYLRGCCKDHPWLRSRSKGCTASTKTKDAGQSKAPASGSGGKLRDKKRAVKAQKGGINGVNGKKAAAAAPKIALGGAAASPSRHSGWALGACLASETPPETQQEEVTQAAATSAAAAEEESSSEGDAGDAADEDVTVVACSNDAGNAKGVGDMAFPLLEQFYWRRVVYDEFHEIEALQTVDKEVLQFLRAHYRWGLTGTPPLSKPRHVVGMASLLRVDVVGPLLDPPAKNGATIVPQPRRRTGLGFGSSSEDEGARADASQKWVGDSDCVTIENCSRFLDSCVRQNSAQMPHIKTVEHLVLLRHTPQERALYLANSSIYDEANSSENSRMQRSQRLLILCSHFCAEALRSTVGSAGEECGRVMATRQHAVNEARAPLRNALGCLEALAELLGREGDVRLGYIQKAIEEKVKGANKDLLEEVKEFLDEASQEARRDRKQLSKLVQVMNDMKTPNALWKVTLRQAARATGGGKQDDNIDDETGLPAAKRQKKPPKVEVPGGPQLAEALETCGRSITAMLDALFTAVGHMLFLQRTLSLVEEGSDKSLRRCSICYDEDLGLDKLGITPCAHVFCLECLRETVHKMAACAICRQSLRPGDARPLMSEIKEAKEAEAPAPVQPDTEIDTRLKKYGTKLAHIARTLQMIKAEDPTAKCIVFCQWQVLLRKVAAAFTDFGIRFGELRGSIYAKTRTIADFKGSESGLDVLLLSLEQSASGSNLTCAHHVLFVHPMNAANQEQAVAFELQAIGRVRRWGQQRPEVHVWRFCTAGTIEEDITKQHQHDIWQRADSEAKAAEERAAVFAANNKNTASTPASSSGRATAAKAKSKQSAGSSSQRPSGSVANDVPLHSTSAASSPAARSEASASGPASSQGQGDAKGSGGKAPKTSRRKKDDSSTAPEASAKRREAAAKASGGTGRRARRGSGRGGESAAGRGRGRGRSSGNGARGSSSSSSSSSSSVPAAGNVRANGAAGVPASQSAGIDMDIDVDMSREWACKRCTLVNHYLDDICVVCEGPRDGGSSAPGGWSFAAAAASSTGAAASSAGPSAAAAAGAAGAAVPLQAAASSASPAAAAAACAADSDSDIECVFDGDWDGAAT